MLPVESNARDGLAEILAFVFMTRVDADGAAGEPRLVDMPESVNLGFAEGWGRAWGGGGGGVGYFCFISSSIALSSLVVSVCLGSFELLPVNGMRMGHDGLVPISLSKGKERQLTQLSALNRLVSIECHARTLGRKNRDAVDAALYSHV
jgi:hypothetical protein